jgi:hypothetical protein
MNNTTCPAESDASAAFTTVSQHENASIAPSISAIPRSGLFSGGPAVSFVCALMPVDQHQKHDSVLWRARGDVEQRCGIDFLRSALSCSLAITMEEDTSAEVR